MTTSLTTSLLSTWRAALASAGIARADLISDSTLSVESADGEARFRWGNLILRLVRDRGQDFVDIASASEPSRLFSLDDVAVAQGWRSVASISARQEPPAVVDELREIACRQVEFEVAFDAKQFALTEAGILEARKKRERSFLDKLNQLADKHQQSK